MHAVHVLTYVYTMKLLCVLCSTQIVLNLCVCMHVRMHECVRACVHACMCMYVCLYICTYVCMNLCMCGFTGG